MMHSHTPRRFLSILIPAFLALAACNTSVKPKQDAGQEALLDPALVQKAGQIMQAYTDSGKLSGISTLVLKDGQVAHRGIFGMADLDENRPMAENTLFRIYSMSKPITAAALMILYDEGKFQLDDPVKNYIPVFSETKVWDGEKEVAPEQDISIRHLLTHTAGFTYGWDQNAYVDSLYRTATPEGMWAVLSLEEMINILAGIPLKHQPGTTYEYSVSIDVAGYLVEVLSGMPFDEFLDARLFTPLGMDDTGFELEEKDWDRLAMIYRKNDAGELEAATWLSNGVKQEVKLFSGGGGLVSSIEDYAKFGQMLLNGGELNGTRVLESSTVDMIMSDQLPPGVVYNDHDYYGLGGSVSKAGGVYGWGGMASTDFSADPENQVVILAFTQYIPFMGEPFANDYKKLIRSGLNPSQAADE